MSEEKKLALAKETFATIRRMMDNNNWKYTPYEEKLSFSTGANGEDLYMDLTIKVDAERQLILVFSKLPLTFPEDKRVDGAVAVSAINRVLYHAGFDYDLSNGTVFYRMCSSFFGSKLSEEACSYMLYTSFQIIDDYNDKLLMLAKDLLSLEQFIASLNS